MVEIISPGFRFYPTEEELISFYLHKKLEGKRPELDRVIPVVTIYDFDPWHLPKFHGELCMGDTEQWFFFVPRQEREARGGRPCRTTNCGYWKATGSPSYVYSSNSKVIGVKKSMVFYKGKAPTGKKTKWKMNEYRAIEEEVNSTISIPKLRHEMSLCRIYVISGSFRAFDRRPIAPTITREPSKSTINQGGISMENVTKMEAISSPDESLAMEEQDYVNLHHNHQIPIINQEININSHNNKRVKSNLHDETLISGWEQFNWM